MTKKIIGYKGFDRDMKCRGFEYEVGKEYKHDGDIELCNKGFHFCEVPLSVLSYYPLSDGNQYAEVEVNGKVKKENDKSVTDKLTVK